MIDPLNGVTTGYHLFLIPTGKIAQELDKTIEVLANTFQSPVFPAHITLLANIPADDVEDLIFKSKALASANTLFDLSFEGVGAERSFFRALYLKVVNAASLSEIYIDASKLFNVCESQVSTYTPHLSLLYGNFPEETISEIGASLPIPGSLSLTLDRLALYRTEGPAEDWCMVAEFPLAKRLLNS